LLAAALAVVGVGVAAALAKAELERRSTQRRERPKSKLQRKTLKQIDRAIALLEGHGQVPPERIVHETRKTLKRARALVRLQLHALGPKRYRRCNAALRQCGRQLAGARDAQVVLDTLDRLIQSHPKQLANSPAIDALRARLLAERERTEGPTGHGAPARAQVLLQLHSTRADLAGWRPSRGDRATAREGLHDIYRQGRRRGRSARKAKTSQALHDWRKRVKDLRYAAEALQLDQVARTADRLGETIGAEHDLWLLAQCLRRHRSCFKGDKVARKALRRSIARRRRRLRRRAFKLGKGLYRQSPKRFVRRSLPS
jgi:CHAD domain-containing protein